MARCSYGNVGGGGWEEWGLDIAAAQTTWTRLGRISCSVGNVRRDSIALKWGESKKRHGLISCVGFVPRTPRLTLWYDVITLRCIVLVLLTHHHTAHQTLTMSLTAMFLFFVFLFFFTFSFSWVDIGNFFFHVTELITLWLTKINCDDSGRTPTWGISNTPKAEKPRPPWPRLSALLGEHQGVLKPARRCDLSLSLTT